MNLVMKMMTLVRKYANTGNLLSYELAFSTGRAHGGGTLSVHSSIINATPSPIAQGGAGKQDHYQRLNSTHENVSE